MLFDNLILYHGTTQNCDPDKIDPVTAYYVVVDTLTSPHDAQKNTVTGTGTVEIAAAFLRITAPTEGIEHITELPLLLHGRIILMNR